MTYSDEIEVYKLQQITDAWGGSSTGSYTKTGYIKGRVLPLSGSEDFINDKLRELASHVVMIPYKIKINASDRLIYQGQKFDILATQKHGIAGKRKEQQLLVQEVKVH